MNKIKSLFSKVKVWSKENPKKSVSIGCILALIVVFGLGFQSAKVSLGNDKVNYEEMDEKIADKEQELKDKKEEVEKEKEDLGDDLEDAKKLVENKSSLEYDVEDLKGDINEKEDKVEKLENKIEDKQDKLDGLSNEVEEKESEPINLSAGKWTVGEDVPEGRYKATNGSSNFVVYDSSGMPKVNTILGEMGEDEYIFNAVDGDEIKTESEVTLVPVK